VRRVPILLVLALSGLNSLAAPYLPGSCGSTLARVDKAFASMGKDAGKLGRRAIQPVLDYIAPPLDPKLLNFEEYAKLAETPIGNYFPEGTVTPEGTKKFLEDFEKVAYSFQRMNLETKGKLRKGQEAVKEISSGIDFLLRNGFAEGGNKHTTLEQLLMRENRARDIPKDLVAKTVAGQLGHLAWEFVKLPGRAGKTGAMLTWDYTKWGFRNVISTSLLMAILSNFIAPPSETLNRLVNENFGFIRLKISLALTYLEDAIRGRYEKLKELIRIKSKIEETNKKLAEVNTLYQIKEISHDDAVKMWDQLFKTFLEYRKEMYAVMKDDVSAGRSYFRDGVINYPLLFVNSAMTANNELMNHEQLILLYQGKKRDVGLSPEEERRLQYHEEELPKSKQRLTTTLVAWKVHEIIYPEFSRASFMKSNPEAIPLFNAYDKFTKNFRMEDYAIEFEREMREQLAEISIPLKEIEKQIQLEQEKLTKPPKQAKP
jgi:hypothetical protein